MSVPVPYRFPGHIPPNSAQGSNVTLEFYVDLQCPYSKKAWDTVKQVLEHFRGRLKLFFIPYVQVGHQQAYDCHRALEVIGRKCGPEKYFMFVDVLFKHQSEFSNPQFKTKSPLDLLRLLATLTLDYGIGLEELGAGMDDDTVFDAIKAAQRRGISLGVWSTPTFYLNGSLLTKVTGGDDVSTWIDYLSSFDIS